MYLRTTTLCIMKCTGLFRLTLDFMVTWSSIQIVDQFYFVLLFRLLDLLLHVRGGLWLYLKSLAVGVLISSYCCCLAFLVFWHVILQCEVHTFLEKFGRLCWALFLTWMSNSGLVWWNKLSSFFLLYFSTTVCHGAVFLLKWRNWVLLLLLSHN